MLKEAVKEAMMEMFKAVIDAPGMGLSFRFPSSAPRSGRVECVLCTLPATGFHKNGLTPLCEDHLKMVGHS